MSQRSVLYDAYLEKVATDDNPFGLLFGNGSRGVIVKRVLSNIKATQFSSRDINSIEVGDVLFAFNNKEVVGFKLEEVLAVITSEDTEENIGKFRFRRNKLENQQFKQQILLHLQNSDGDMLDLRVEIEDDPYEKAKEFVEIHNLPPSVIPILVQQILSGFNESAPYQESFLDDEKSNFSDGNGGENHSSKSFYRAKQNAIRRESQSLSPTKLHRSLSFSSSPSIKSSASPQRFRPVKNQEFFNRMHDEARKSKERKSLERSLILKDYEKQIEQSSFRYQFQNHRHYTDSDKFTQIRDGKDVFEQLYNDHKHWWKKRNEKTERLKVEIEEKRESELKQDLTFSPRRATSPNRQVQRSFKSTDEFYDHLYSWTNYFTERNKQRKAQENLQFRSSATFTPELNSKSRMLATKRSFRRRHSFDASSINTESIFVSRPNTPTSSGKLQPNAIESPWFPKSPTGEVTDDFRESANPDPNEQLSPAKELTLNTDIIEKLQSFSIDESNAQKDELYWLSIVNKSQTPGRLLQNDLESSDEHKYADFNLFQSPNPADDVFHRLYSEAREERKIGRQKLREKYQPVHSHFPDIGVNTTFPVEKKKDDFFERLYRFSEKQRTKDLLAKIEKHENLLQKNKRSLTPKECEAVVERLMFKQAKVEKAKENVKESIYQNIQLQSRSSFISDKTEKLARKKIEHSLQEIFQVLVLTEHMYKEMGTTINIFKESDNVSGLITPVPKVKPNEELISVKKDPTDPADQQLDLEFVDARHIEPLELSQSIQQILLSFIFGKPPQRIITLRQFIDRSIELISSSTLPAPICHLLTPMKRYEERKRKDKLHLSTEERILLEQVQDKPKLVAEKVTNKLTDDRYRDRKHKKISIEDSLLSYIEINNNKMEMLKREIEEEKTAECTFQPMLIASYFRDRNEEQNERRRRANRRFRSHSAPSRAVQSEQKQIAEIHEQSEDVIQASDRPGTDFLGLANKPELQFKEEPKNYLLTHTNYYGRNEVI